MAILDEAVAKAGRGVSGARSAAEPYQREAHELERAAERLKATIKYAQEDLKLVTARQKQVTKVAKALQTSPRARELADRVREAHFRWSTAGTPEGKKTLEKAFVKAETAWSKWFNRLWSKYKGPGSLSHITKRD